MKKIFYLLLIPFLIQGCSSVKAQNYKNIPYEILDSGAYGEIIENLEKIVNNKTEYDYLFSKLYREDTPAPFSYSTKNSYIFLIFREQTVGGLNYEVNKIEQEDGTIKITLNTINNEKQPLIKTMAIAHPYIILHIDKTDAKQLNIIINE